MQQVLHIVLRWARNDETELSSSPLTTPFILHPQKRKRSSLKIHRIPELGNKLLWCTLREPQFYLMEQIERFSLEALDLGSLKKHYISLSVSTLYPFPFDLNVLFPWDSLFTEFSWWTSVNSSFIIVRVYRKSTSSSSQTDRNNQEIDMQVASSGWFLYKPTLVLNKWHFKKVSKHKYINTTKFIL